MTGAATGYFRKIVQIAGFSCCVLTGSVYADTATYPYLSLEEAERLALANHPALKEHLAMVDAEQARAIYTGQLPDPQLRLGVDSLPTNRYALNQDGMTQMKIGISQAFPPIGKLALNRQSAAQESMAVRLQHEDMRAQVLRTVRKAWVELFYKQRAIALHHVNIELGDQIMRAAAARYKAGQTHQMDVIQAQLERDDLMEHEQTLIGERDAARSVLARLINQPGQLLSMPGELPTMDDIPLLETLLDKLPQHPQMRVLAAQDEAAMVAAEAAHRDFYPEFGIEASYGMRFAREADGSKLPDLLSAGIVLSLPLFPDKRQNARWQERQAQALEVRYRREDVGLQLRQQAEAQYAVLDRLKNRLKWIDETLLPETRQIIDTALAAYRVTQMSMADVLKARQSNLEYELRRWRLRADIANVRADLFYLATQTTEHIHEP